MKTKDLERALDSRPSTSQEAVALLGAALGNRYASVVVKAVRRLGEWQVAGMKSELLAEAVGSRSPGDVLTRVLTKGPNVLNGES